jgi:hypothetical protein
MVAGAFGTLLINAATYVDMALTGRQASGTPAETVLRTTESLGVRLPDDGGRPEAYGALAGMATGVGVGVVASLARKAGLRLPAPVGAVAIGALAMAGTDGAMAAEGISDPREWTATDWARDAIPHLIYGAGVRWAMDRVDASDRASSHADRPAGYLTPEITPAKPSRLGVLARSAMLGVATGCRSSLGLGGPLAASGRGPAALAAAALVSTELAVDKVPGIPSRLAPAPLAGRMAGGAVGAGALARGRFDADAGVTALAGAAGAAGAWVGSVAGAVWRDLAAERGWTWQAGLVEDAVALGLTVRACR